MLSSPIDNILVEKAKRPVSKPGVFLYVYSETNEEIL